MTTSYAPTVVSVTFSECTDVETMSITYTVLVELSDGSTLDHVITVMRTDLLNPHPIALMLHIREQLRQQAISKYKQLYHREIYLP